jgi:ribosomal protein S12 methylthiotransferase accessory factor
VIRLAYNTNSTQNHRLKDAVALIADSGYDGVALTLDVNHLDPFAPDLVIRCWRLRGLLERFGLAAVIETGARFLLDPRSKHEPTLISPSASGRARRLDFLTRAVQVAEAIGAEAVSFWAGVPIGGAAEPGAERDQAWSRLRDGVATLAEHAAGCGVTLAFEPEPGMLVETVEDWRRLAADVPGLGLALDVGHCLVTGEADPADVIRAEARALRTVHIEDIRRGEHVHLPFGEGELDLPAVLRALDDVRFGGLVSVELSRDSHRADLMVPAAMEALRAAMPRSLADPVGSRP